MDKLAHKNNARQPLLSEKMEGPAQTTGRSRATEASKALDSFQTQIHQLYIVENKKVDEVLRILRSIDGLHQTTRKILLTKLRTWGYMKNIKRVEVVKILQEQTDRGSAGKGTVVTIGRRRVDLEKVERHARRAGLHHLVGGAVPRRKSAANRYPGAIACRSVLSPSMPVIECVRTPEKLLRDLDTLIKGSFEAGLWKSSGVEHIILSSPSQNADRLAMHNLYSNLDSGCAAAEEKDFLSAGAHWGRAFENVDSLVKGQYHAIIPSLIQKINDLNKHHGLVELAEKLKNHIATCSKAFLPPGSPTSVIYQGLAQLDMSSIAEIEPKIMRRFIELFDNYLEPGNYNAFLLMINAAKRRLLYDNWASLNECLPDPSGMDAVSGPSDCRALEIMALRLHTLNHRRLYRQAEGEAFLLIARAAIVTNDQSQRLQNLVRGYFHLGRAQHILGNSEAARQSFLSALQYEEKFCELSGDDDMFKVERAAILKYLEGNALAVCWRALEVSC